MDHVNNPYSSRPMNIQGYPQSEGDLGHFLDQSHDDDMQWSLPTDQLSGQTFFPQPDYHQNGNHGQAHFPSFEGGYQAHSHFDLDSSSFQDAPYYPPYTPAPTAYGQPGMGSHHSTPQQGYQMLQEQNRTFSPAQGQHQHQLPVINQQHYDPALQQQGAPVQAQHQQIPVVNQQQYDPALQQQSAPAQVQHQQVPVINQQQYDPALQQQSVPVQVQHQQGSVINQQQYDPDLQQQWGHPTPPRPIYSPHPTQQYQQPLPQKSPQPTAVQTHKDGRDLSAQVPAYQVSTLQPRVVSTPEPKSRPKLSPKPIIPAKIPPSDPKPNGVPDAKPQPAAEISQPSRVPLDTVPRQASPVPSSLLLRVTHSELLAKFAEGSEQRLTNAPFLVVTGDPINLEIKGKTTIPKYHPRNNRSGKPVAGLDLSIAAVPAKPTRALKPKPASRKSKVTAKDTGITDVKIRVPRPAATGPKSAVASPEISSEEDESSSAEEGSSDEEDEIMVIDRIEDHRAMTRPIGLADAAAYDAVGLVWIERHRHPNVDEISKAIQSFQDFISVMREDIKKVALDITKAQTEKKLADVKKFTTNREVRRSALTKALKAAKEHGHPDVLQNLGNSQRLVVALSMTLLDCVKAEDYDGTLPRAVLELMTEFKTLTDELLKRAKFDKVESRLSKKGDASIKGLLSTISKNTLAYEDKIKKTKAGSDPLKAKLEDNKTEQRKSLGDVPPATTANLKRVHPGDGANAQPAKKPAPNGKSTTAPKTTTAQPATKVAPTPARTSNIFSSLQKPGTKSAAAAKAAQAKTAPKKEATPAPPPQPSAFAALLASIEKPKELPKAPAAPERAPETPEEKAKRERKESRRHLRVKFREGAELEQIRLFKHEVAEDEGRQEEMVRDAHDERSEGMMHKQRAAETKQNDPDAMDEDEDISAEVEFRPYPNLIGVDFSGLDPAVLEKNYTSRGGNRTFTTSQQQIQSTREATELMAFYTADSDIPTSAKEPVNPYNGESRVEIAFGQPTDPKLVQRLQDIQQYGPERALLGFLSKNNEDRARAGHNMNNPYQSQSSANSADISAILAAMNGNNKQQQQAQQQQHQYTPPQQVAPLPPALDWDIIRRAVEMTKGKPYPPTEPPEWMTAAGQLQWWEGFNADKAEAQRKLVESQRAVAAEKAAQMFAAHQAQTPAPPQVIEAPQPQMQQPFAGFSGMPNLQGLQGGAMDAQIQSLLVGMQMQNNAQSTPSPNYTNGWWNQNGTQYDAQQAQSYNQGQGQDQGYVQNQAPTQHTVHPSRNWVGIPDNSAPALNNISNNYGDFQNQNQNQNQNQSQTKHNENVNSFDENKSGAHGNQGGNGAGGGAGGGGWKKKGKRTWPDDNYKKGTKPCKYFSEGKCLKGDKCTYRHDIAEGLYG